MKRLLTTTTALALGLSPLAPLPLLAQTELKLGDQVVICLPDADTACPEGATCLLTPKGPCGKSREALAEARKAARLAAAAAQVALDTAAQATLDAADTEAAATVLSASLAASCDNMGQLARGRQTFAADSGRIIRQHPHQARFRATVGGARSRPPGLRAR